MHTVHPSSLLRIALVSDAIVSGAVAIGQLALVGPLSELLGIPCSLLAESGAFLVLYTMLLVALARSARVPSAMIRMVVLGNVVWAVGCAALLAMETFAFTTMGVAFVMVQIAVVTVFAVLEFVGLGRSERVTELRGAATL